MRTEPQPDKPDARNKSRAKPKNGAAVGSSDLVRRLRGEIKDLKAELESETSWANAYFLMCEEKNKQIRKMQHDLDMAAIRATKLALMRKIKRILKTPNRPSSPTADGDAGGAKGK